MIYGAIFIDASPLFQPARREFRVLLVGAHREPIDPRARERYCWCFHRTHAQLQPSVQRQVIKPHRQMFEEQKQCKGFYRTGTKVIWKKFWRKIIFGMRQKHFWSTDNKRPLKFHLVIGVIMCFSTSMGGGRERLCKKLALFNGRQSCSWSHKQILEYSNCNILD